jgi:hypothetical protein
VQDISYIMTQFLLVKQISEGLALTKADFTFRKLRYWSP